jgi:CBS domain-containing protein
MIKTRIRKGATMKVLQGLSTSLANFSVSDAMHAGVFTCPPATPLREVARMMATYRIHCVVVKGDESIAGDEMVWGVVSDLDLVTVAAGDGIDDRTAGATAASAVVVVTPDQTLDRAAQLMKEYSIAHLVVVDPESMHPVGVLSTLDVAAIVAAPPWRDEETA